MFSFLFKPYKTLCAVNFGDNMDGDLFSGRKCSFFSITLWEFFYVREAGVNYAEYCVM
jgi:hypothetical protein